MTKTAAPSPKTAPKTAPKSEPKAEATKRPHVRLTVELPARLAEYATRRARRASLSVPGLLVQLLRDARSSERAHAARETLELGRAEPGGVFAVDDVELGDQELDDHREAEPGLVADGGEHGEGVSAQP